MKNPSSSFIGSKEDLLRRKKLTPGQIAYILSTDDPVPVSKSTSFSKPAKGSISRESKELEIMEKYDYVQEVLLIPVDIHLILKEIAGRKHIDISKVIIDILRFETQYSIIESFKEYAGV